MYSKYLYDISMPLKHKKGRGFSGNAWILKRVPSISLRQDSGNDSLYYVLQAGNRKVSRKGSLLPNMCSGLFCI